MTTVPSLTPVLASIETAIQYIRQVLETELGSHNLPDEDEKEFEDRENTIVQLEDAIADLESAIGHIDKAGVKPRLSGSE